MRQTIRRTVTTVGLLIFPALAIAQPSDITDGRAIYLQSCAGCHGQDLTGGQAKSMVDGDWQYGGRRQDVFRSTKFGIVQAGMPAYEGGLSDTQINSVVDYILAQEQRAAPKKGGLPDELSTRDYTLKVDVFAEGLREPWGIAFINERHALITEKAGPIRQVVDGKLLPEPVKGTPRTQVMGQGGMMAVSVDPQYGQGNGDGTNDWIYLGYSHPRDDRFTSGTPTMTRIVRGKIVDNTWTDQQVLFEAKPDHYRNAGVHFGTRIVFDRQGHLYFAIGDRGAQDQAQDVTRPNGKSHRIHRDGSIPKNNPFVGKPDAYESIWSYGNRNIQGLAVQPGTDNVWGTEHGPLGGDELNFLKPGLNYGWPVITFGRNYNGTEISKLTAKDGMEQPDLQWTPSPAMCGLDFYNHKSLPKWQGNLLAGALKFQEVKRLVIENGKVVDEEVIVKNLGRVRDVKVGPDGAIYVVLNGPDTVLKLSAQP
jgi:aldose sugar dehydrogenase